MNSYNVTVIDTRGLPTTSQFGRYEEASGCFHRAAGSENVLYAAFVRFDPNSGETETLNQFCNGATFA